MPENLDVLLPGSIFLPSNKFLRRSLGQFTYKKASDCIEFFGQIQQLFEDKNYITKFTPRQC